MDVFCQDTKLNLSPYYLKPGFAYGGSCLPKEVRAVAHIGQNLGLDLPMIESLGTSNAAHIQAALDMVRRTGAKRVGVLGVAFKPGTDDLRESPVLEVIAALREEGVEVLVHDTAITQDTPLAGQLAYVQYGSAGLASLATALPQMLREDVTDVTDHADALIVTHANDTYRTAVENAGNVPVIDVCRLHKDADSSAKIEGIGW